MKKVYIGSILSLVALLIIFLGCGGGSSGSSDAGTSGTMKSIQYTLDAEKTLQVTGDLIIESDSSIIIDGDIVALGETGQNIILKAVDDINISGDIISGSGDATQREGGSVTLISENGNINIVSGAHLQAGDGVNGDIFSVKAPLLRVANKNYQGANGGSIVIKAVLGSIRVAEDAGILHIGNGGNGTDVNIQGDDLIGVEILESYNNNGGDAGILDINSSDFIKFTTIDVISGAQGGDGGDIIIATDENNNSTWPQLNMAKLRGEPIVETEISELNGTIRLYAGVGGWGWFYCTNGGAVKFTGQDATEPGSSAKNIEALGGGGRNSAEDRPDDMSLLV